MSLLTAGLLFLGLLPPAMVAPASGAPAARTRRGPIDSRDEFLLAQGRLTLPAASPDALPRGQTRVRLAGDWGNDFGYRVGVVGGEQRLLYLIDGEHASGAVQLSHGLGDGLALQVRLPLLWRGGGVMDGLIEGWHRLLGLPDGNRPRFPRDQLLVLALDRGRHELHWRAPDGSGLGGIELGARWSPGTPDAGWTGAAEARVQLPTGTAGFGGGGLQAGAQAVAARPLGGAGDVYLGLGATAGPRTRHHDIAYAPLRPQGFVAFEWRPWPPVSLLAEAHAGGRLVDNVEGFPGLHLVLRLGAKVDVADGWRLEGGFTEGLTPVAATTDFGVMLGLERTF